MSLLQAIAIGIPPSFVWAWLIHRRDDHEREPVPLVLVAMAFGSLAAGGVLWLRPLLEANLPPAGELADAFLLTSLHEEGWKLLALLPLLLHRELDEPLDGVVYGAAVALGFAAVENVIFCARTDSAVLALQRAFTATLAHVACTGGLGFCCARGKLGRGRPRASAWIGGGLVLAVLQHGCYDVFLTGERGRALIALLVVLPGTLTLLALKLRWARARSRQFHPEAAD
jgi:RsiW-degrading membrane proteinase PrsW (M82 family)